jgi:queuine/archaeosine tRNA-ribosyltransferase
MTLHNIYFMTHTTQLIRDALKDGTFAKLKYNWLGRD